MIKAILDPYEKILWEDKPDRFIYVLGHIRAYIMLICFAVVSSIIIYFLFGEDDARLMLGISAILPILVVSGYIYRIFNWRRIHYVVTDKRIYIESGVVGRDIDLIGFVDVKEPSLFVDTLEKLRGKGTIRMNPYLDRSQRRKFTNYAFSILHVSEPERVFKIIEQ